MSSVVISNVGAVTRDGRLPSGWPEVQAWRASSAVSGGVARVDRTSASRTSGESDTNNGFLPAAAPAGSRLRAALSKAAACSADSGKPFNGMGVTRTSPTALCGRHPATNSATCAPMLWPTTITGRADVRSSASSTSRT